MRGFGIWRIIKSFIAVFCSISFLNFGSVVHADQQIATPYGAMGDNWISNVDFNGRTLFGFSMGRYVGRMMMSGNIAGARGIATMRPKFASTEKVSLVQSKIEVRSPELFKPPEVRLSQDLTFTLRQNLADGHDLYLRETISSADAASGRIPDHVMADVDETDIIFSSSRTAFAFPAMGEQAQGPGTPGNPLGTPRKSGDLAQLHDDNYSPIPSSSGNRGFSSSPLNWDVDQEYQLLFQTFQAWSGTPEEWEQMAVRYRAYLDSGNPEALIYDPNWKSISNALFAIRQRYERDENSDVVAIEEKQHLDTGEVVSGRYGAADDFTGGFHVGSPQETTGHEAPWVNSDDFVDPAGGVIE